MTLVVQQVQLESPEETQCVNGDTLASDCFRGWQLIVRTNGAHKSSHPTNKHKGPAAGLCDGIVSPPFGQQLKHKEGTTLQLPEGTERVNPAMCETEAEDACDQQMITPVQAIGREEGTIPGGLSGVSSSDAEHVRPTEKCDLTLKAGNAGKRVIHVPRLSINELGDSAGGLPSRRSHLQRASDISLSMVTPAELSPHEVIYLKLLYYYKWKSRSARENLWGPSDLICWHCCRRPSVADGMTKALIKVLRGRADAPVRHRDPSVASAKTRCSTVSASVYQSPATPQAPYDTKF